MGVCTVWIMQESFLSVDIKAIQLKECGRRKIAVTSFQCFPEAVCFVEMK